MERDAERTAQPAAAPRRSEAALLALRSRLRRVAIGEVLAAGLGLVLVALLAEALIDYLLRLPSWLRIALLIVGLAALTAGVRNRLLPALRLRPKLSTLALRAERSALGAERQLTGVLASGVELAHQRPEPTEPGSIAWLRSAAADRADSASVPLTSLVRTNTLRHQALGLAASAAVIALIAILSPATATTGLQRTLLPWTDASWPKRTEVADATPEAPHALGSALPLRALVTRTNRSVGDTPVEVVYRIVTPTSSTPARTEPLTGQETFEMSAAGTPGEAYERLIEPAVNLDAESDEAWLEYAFQTPDDRTPTRRIRLVEPPRITALTATIEPPAYAPLTEGSTWVAGALDLGLGQDERAVVGPVLVGSRITVTATLSKPADLVGDPLTSDAPTTPDIATEKSTHVISWLAEDRASLKLRLQDELGITSVDDATVRVETLSDREPTVTVTLPERDEAVLATALIDLAGEARDDVGLSWLALRAQPARIPPSAQDSAGATPEAQGDPIELVRADSTELRAQARATLDLAPLSLTVGDEVLITAIAADVYDLTAPDGSQLTHGETVSTPRRLRIISEAELVEQILAELGGVRRGAVRLAEQQTELIEQVRTSRTTGQPPIQSMARDQAALTDALDRLTSTVEQLAQRTSRNGLDDAALQELLQRSDRALDLAADESEKAASELSAAAEQQQPERTEQAEESQQRVRRSLEDLAMLLDRGEDSWAVRQALEGLLEDQRELSEQTAEIGEQTVGRSASQLSAEELTELDRIAQRQLELADRSASLLDELDTRSQDLAETDPGQAAAMRAAARRGREQGVPQSLEQAAESVQSNNTADAGRQQQQAAEQLEQMLKDLDEAEKQRDQELQRALLSLIESIEALVRTQQSELASLVAVRDNPAALAPLAAGMNALYRNTLSVADEASTNPDTARIAGLITEAAAAQSDAIAALRTPDAPLAERHEELSLTRLEAALTEAEQQMEDAEERERERRKLELKKAYTEALTFQSELSAATDPLVKDRLSRREQADARDLGRREQELRETLRALPAQYEEITAAGVFDLAHQRIDTQLDSVGTALTAGKASRTQRRMQASVESLLAGLIAALEDPEQKDSPFSDSEQQQGGEGQGGQSQPEEMIPPLAELRLLRTMQQDLLDQTRMMEEFGASPDEAREVGEIQTDLALQGDVLIEKLKQQQAGGQPLPMPEPMPEPEQPEGDQ